MKIIYYNTDQSQLFATNCLVVLSLIVHLCAVAQTNHDQNLYVPSYDPKKVEKAKVRLAFDEFESKAPRYQNVVTNWNPQLTPCGSVTNFGVKSPNTDEGGVGYTYLGKAEDKWIFVRYFCFASRREAHEYMMKVYSDTPTGGPFREDETTNPKDRIGFRCFRKKVATGEGIDFICNNIYVEVSGKGVGIEGLARDLERQILALSGTLEPAGLGNAARPTTTPSSGPPP